MSEGTLTNALEKRAETPEGKTVTDLIDRMRLGYVIDFVDAHIGPHHWPAFNVADSAISVGVTLLVLDMLRRPEPDEPTPARVPATSSGGD